MTATMTATEARYSLPAILDRVADGEEVLITRHGRPVAVIMRPDAVRVRRADAILKTAAGIRTLVEVSGDQPLSPSGSLDESYAETLIDEIRHGRDTR